MSIFKKKKVNDSFRPRRRLGELEKKTTSFDTDLKSLKTNHDAFRLGTTITGTTAMNVRSAGEKNANVVSDRTKLHKLSDYRSSLGILLSLITGVSLILVLLISQFVYSPKVVANTDISNEDKNQIAKEISSYFNGRPFEAFRFMVNDKKLTEYLRSKIPEVETAYLKRDNSFFKPSSFVINLRKPVASWEFLNKTLYVDGSGTTFNRNYYSDEDTKNVIKVVDQSVSDNNVGKSVTSERFLTFIGTLAGNASKFDLTVNNIVIKANQARQIEVYFVGISYPIIFSIERGVGVQLEDAKRSIDHLKSKGIYPKYLDIRVSRQAYYR